MSTGLASALVAVGLALASPSAVAPAAAATATFGPVADTFVDSSSPTVAAGSGPAMVADGDPSRVAYLRFSLTGVTGGITRAQLRLHVQDSWAGPSPKAGAIARVASTTWPEATTTWANRPAVGATITPVGGAATQAAWITFDVTSAVSANGLLSLAVVQTDPDGVFYDTREAGAGLAPQLVVTSSGTVTPPAGPASFAPAADTSVDASIPTVAAGTSPSMVADASPERVAYLRFPVSGLTGTVSRAVLRLHVQDTNAGQSDRMGRASRVASTTWSETATTWANRPAVGALLAAPSGPATSGAWVSFDVTAAVAGNGLVSLAVTSTSWDGVFYDTREAGAAVAPRLEVTVGVAPAADPVLLAAGDIAGCTWDGDELTAQILDRYPTAPIAGLGDMVQVAGTAAEFRDCYQPTWGRHLARTRPAIGNHEYVTDKGKAYWDYFGSAAGPRDKGYYSYDVGSSWHVVVLNGSCWYAGGCAATDPQATWLKADLAANPRPCTLAYWHQPYWSSIEPTTTSKALLDILYAAKAELILNGHKHGYERFAPQRPDGTRDDVNGLRQIVVATGGSPYFYVSGPPKPNSEVRATDLHGVLKLTLSANRYRWDFLQASDTTFTDTGTNACH